MTDTTNAQLAEQIAGHVVRLLDAGLIPPAPGGPPIEYLTPPEAAAYTRLSYKALEHLRASDTGPPWRKVSGKVRYRLADLRAWMEQGAEA